MSEEKVRIILKAEFDKPRSVTVGNKTLEAAPGTPVEVPAADADMWIKTGRFERVEPVKSAEKAEKTQSKKQGGNE